MRVTSERLLSGALLCCALCALRCVETSGVAANPPMYSALGAAAADGKTKDVWKLVESGADIEERGGPGNSTPLLLAISGGHPDVAAQLLYLGAKASARDIDGSTPMQCAAFRGFDALVQLLLDQGAEPSEKDNFGMTPLHLAMHADQRAVVVLLLQHGADMWAKTLDGNTPKDLATGNLQLEIAAIPGMTRLHLAFQCSRDQAALFGITSREIAAMLEDEAASRVQGATSPVR